MMLLSKLGARNRVDLWARSSLSHSLAASIRTLREMQENVCGKDMVTAGCGGGAGRCDMHPGEQSWAGSSSLLTVFFQNNGYNFAQL